MEVFYGVRIQNYFFLLNTVNTWVASPDCLEIDLRVPEGISFLPAGTIAVFGPLLYLAWLPF